MNIPALLGCLSFYSALYLIYFFFAEQKNPLLLLAAVALLILTVYIVPNPQHERRRRSFNDTLNFETYFTWPLWTYWRMFIYPVRWLLSYFYRD